MDIKRLDALLAYILVEAQKAEDFRERSLGPIHFIKYVYLADLVYAEQHGGLTYTGIQWKFHHFGPWSVDLWLQIEPRLASFGAVAVNFPSSFSTVECTRWIIDSFDTIQSRANDLSIELKGVISNLVRRFSTCTPELLDFVYKTPPMLRAAPEEYLDFTPSGWSFREEMPVMRYVPEHSERQKKKIKEWKLRASSIFQAKIAERISQNRNRSPLISEDLYDDVYLEGVAALDDMNTPLPEGQIKVAVLDNVWKSKARYDP